MKAIISYFFLFFVLNAQADVKGAFDAAMASNKGPFGQNMLQGETSRAVVTDSVPDKVQFQAAYRNDTAKQVAIQHDLYLANLYTTNYYELMGEYVYGDPYGSHALDHAALIAKSSEALPKASTMVRNWVLERYYTTAFPSSKLARVFRLRGISDMSNEQEYARYFLNFYLSSISQDFQYLQAYLLAQGSPISSSGLLEKARVDIAVLYDELKLEKGEKDPGVLRLYQLRNAIHNQLSYAVIAQIDAFMKEYPGYGPQTLASIRKNLVSYYSVSAARVVELAKKATATKIQAAAEAIVKQGVTPQTALALSTEAVALRSSLLNEEIVPSSKKTDALLVLFAVSEFLSKEINNMKTVTSKEVVKTLVNLVYIEGFLIRDNWQYFVGEVDSASSAQAAAAVFGDMSEIAQETLNQAFKPTFDMWVQIEPKMHMFMDNTIKSSALNTASTIAPRIK